MNYDELGIRERYNECMYDERDIIEKFLKDQYDLRYGHQRDAWHFEPAVKMLSNYGNVEHVTDIMLDKDRFVIFILDDAREYECFDFAYGELSNVIEALPDADELNKKNAICDLKSITRNYNTIDILQDYPFEFNGQKIVDIEDMGKEGIKLILDDKNFTLDTSSAIPLRDHLNVGILHGYNEYKKLIKMLSEQPNLRFDPANFGDVEFTIHGTDMKVDVLSASLDSNGKLQLCVDDDNKETIYLKEKDIRPEYLVDLVGYMKDHCRCNIMDTYNAHNPELVRKINDAWKSSKYDDSLGDILFAFGCRDKQEIMDKLDVVIDCNETAMDNAHEILEYICDDTDLQVVLDFIRYQG